MRMLRAGEERYAWRVGLERKGRSTRERLGVRCGSLMSLQLRLRLWPFPFADVGTSSPVDFILEDFASSNFQNLQVSTTSVQ